MKKTAVLLYDSFCTFEISPVLEILALSGKPISLDAVSGYGFVDDWILCALSLCSRANECTDDP